MLLKTLEKIGLSKKQAKIYLACLELGKTSIKDIAKKSGIKRTSIYDVIDDMISDGFIKVTTIGKRKRFLAVSPDELKKLIKRRELLLGQILPDLNSISNLQGKKPKIWFYEGADGLKDIYNDVLSKSNSTIYGWASEDVLDILGMEWFGQYLKKKKARKVYGKFILPNTSKMQSDVVSKNKQQLRQSKLIDPERYPFKGEVNIYDNKVALISTIDKMGVIIESKYIYDTMKMMFQLCWDQIH